MMRCATYTLALALPAWGLLAAFFTPWYWLLIAAGGVLWIAADITDKVTR
ncbi:MAG: hypothetical protein K0U84_01805 [Actinomycetia bacterium]|nr:hypothetical protein [Actinomycetes bacterium]